MTEEKKPPFFRVLNGASSPDSRVSTAPPTLRIVPVRNVPAIQLGLPLADSRRETVVSLGYYGLTVECLRGLVRAHAPRFFVDLRLAPSFNAGPLSRQFVASLFSECGVQYFHMSELANRFVGTTLDYREELNAYAQHVVKTSHFSQLATMLGRGPIVLLGGGHEHEESERTVLVDALRTRYERLDLVIWSDR